MTDVTGILNQIDSGEPAATRLADQKPGQTLGATALVHVAYLRMVDADARSAELVKLRFFAGLSIAHPAGEFETFASTAESNWAYAIT